MRGKAAMIWTCAEEGYWIYWTEKGGMEKGEVKADDALWRPLKGTAARRRSNIYLYVNNTCAVGLSPILHFSY